MAYRSQEKYDMSEQYFKRALDMFETHLGSDDPQVANTSENIAELYMKTNRESQAKVYQRRALEIRSKHK
jgi:Tfp pilus assembly protein PilF